MGFRTYFNDIGYLGTALMSSRTPMRYLLYISEVASWHRSDFLTFLAFCLRGLSWQNIFGTTIEGCCMRDGHQLFPPVARRTPAQEQA